MIHVRVVTLTSALLTAILFVQSTDAVLRCIVRNKSHSNTLLDIRMVTSTCNDGYPGGVMLIDSR